MKIVIIGGVAGGATTAARLRRLDETAEIIILEKGSYISYANCGLPYYIGGVITDKANLTVQTPEGFNGFFNVDVRVNSCVTSIDSKNKSVVVYNDVEGIEYIETFDKLVIATGASPIVPSNFLVDQNGSFTLRNIPDTFKIKNYIDNNNVKSAVIIGGGFIGLEMTENLMNNNINVSLIEGTNQVLSSLDYDMVCSVHNELRNNGVNLLLNTLVKSINKVNDKYIVDLENTKIETDLVIVSIGIRPETSICQNTGIALTNRGQIIVDEHMKTSVDNIYALGDDCITKDYLLDKPLYIPLAGPANRQARVCADSIMNKNNSYKGSISSSICKIFDLNAASVGLNEKKCQANNIEYQKVITVSASNASYYPGSTPVTIKLIFDKSTGVVLGAQLLGQNGVDKRADVLAMAIRNRNTIYDITDAELCYAPPFSSAKDPVNISGYAAQNIYENLVKPIYPEQLIGNLTEDKIYLDVRSVYEYSAGSIKGFENIPLPILRSKLNELDKTKPIVVTCQVGQRGYYAARILALNGFNVYNLVGGYYRYMELYLDYKSI